MLCVLWCALLVVALPGTARAEDDIRLKNLVLENEEGQVVARFGLSIVAAAELANLMREGEVLALRMEADFFRKRTLWLDSRIGVAETLFLLRHDALTREFVIQPPEGRPVRGTDFSLLARQRFDAIRMDLGPWPDADQSEDGETRRYSLELAVSVDRLEVPSWVQTVLFFWDFEPVSTAVYSLDFEY